MKFADTVKKKTILIITVIVAALLVVYFGIAIFFSSHFLFNTRINDEDVSGKDAAQIEQELSDKASGYVLTISGRGNLKEDITSDEVKLHPVFDGTFEKLIKQQNVFLWPVNIFMKTNLEADSVAEYDDSLFDSRTAALVFDNESEQKQPVDATYKYENAKYDIVPEDEGSTIIASKMTAAISKSLEEMQTELDLDEAGCYEEPSVRSDDANLIKLVDNLNKYAGVDLKYTFGSATEIVDGAMVSEWLVINGTNVTLDRDKVSDYVTSLMRKYDTFGKTRSFNSSKDGVITVSGGHYGWWTDKKSTTDALIEAINNGTKGDIKPVYIAEGAQYGENDIGSSYVEIDLDKQHVYVYKEGKLVAETDCVSGKASVGNFTPDGTYAITYKEKDATLNGENYSSDVKFWIPFNGNIGMHDASWRSSFGGEIYVASGSHGCVNLPTDKAKSVFDNVEKGEAVVVYGGMNTKQATEYLKKKTGTDTNTMTAAEATAAAQKAQENAVQAQAAALKAAADKGSTSKEAVAAAKKAADAQKAADKAVAAAQKAAAKEAKDAEKAKKSANDGSTANSANASGTSESSEDNEN